MDGIKKIYFTLRTLPSVPLFFGLWTKLGLRGAAMVGLGYAVLYCALAIAARRITKLDYGFAGFWLAGVAAGLIDPQWGGRYFSGLFTTFLYFFLFLAAVLPLLFGAEPFTVAFARRGLAPGLEKTPQFLAINKIMTLVWAGLFLTALAISLLPGLLCQTVIPIALMLGIGLPFTKRFPAWYLSRPVKAAPARPGTALSSQTASVADSNLAASADEERKRVAVERGPIRKAVVVFGSPRGTTGHTYKMLEAMLAGMRAEGVEPQLIDLTQYKIKPCLGCFGCWTKTPGKCIQQDDMAALLPKISDTDLVIYAQPLYVFSVPGIAKNFLDRLLPRLQPFLVENAAGETRHPLRSGEAAGPRMLVFSVCGFPEKSHFAGLLTTFRQLAQSGNTQIIGEVLRPGSESLAFSDRLGARYQAVIAGLTAAGREVVRQGYVSRATEEAISQPLVRDVAPFRQLANRFWEIRLRYEEERRQGKRVEELGDFLRNDLAIFFHGMASFFDAEQAGSLQAVIQFEVSSSPGGEYYLTIADSKCRAQEGRAAHSDLLIRTPWTVWKAIGTGELSGVKALSEGRFQAEGDFGLLARMKEIFAA